MRVMQFAGAREPGGLLGHVMILADELRRRGHDVVSVLCAERSVDAAAGRMQAAGLAVRRLSVRGKTDLSGLSSLRRLVRSARPDLFHMHLASPVEGIPALLAARCAAPRAIVTTEHAPTYHPLARFYSRAGKRLAGRAVDAVIAVCRSDADYLDRAFGVRRDSLVVIPNGVPDPGPALPRQEARRRLGLPEAAGPVVGFVGALEPNKGISDLIEALEGVPAPGLTLALAGEGSLAAPLASRARQPGSIRMALAGRVDPIGPFLSALDLFVLPSRQEAMPLALLEAMRAGLPIVATRVGGIPEAIQDEATGLLVPPGDPGALRAALAGLLRDGDRALAMGRAARQVADRLFTSSRMADDVEALYRRLLARSRGADA